jgi:hypothetical protein
VVRHSRRTLTALIAGAALATAVVTACDDHTAMRIPPGAQQVRVVGTGTEPRLDPPIVRAGDIYFVIDGPVIFIQGGSVAPGEQSGPLSEDALARLAQKGDTYHTSRTAGMGKVSKFTLAAGKYAFINGVSDAPLMVRGDLCSRDLAACAALPPLPMAVLEVLH